jgi:hypothetical protein
MIVAVVGVGGAFAASIDSSALVFDDTKIHAYELTFYTEHWVDSLEYYKNQPTEEYIPARCVYRMGSDSIVLDSIGVRYKGNSSYNFAANSPKKPFKFSFDEYKAGQRFFGIKKINFSNGAKDPTMLREKIAYDIIGRYLPAPRAAFATIAVAGTFIGLYTQVEQVDKIFLGRHFADNDGNLYKSSDNGASLLYKGPNASDYAAEYELKTNETANDWSAFIAMLQVLNNAAAVDFTRSAGGSLALDNACRYLAFNMVLSNFDSYTGSGRNFYAYDDPSAGRFTIIPWDLNLAFGVYTNNWNVTTADIGAVSNAAQRPLNKRILDNDSLRQTYCAYIAAMIDGPAATDSIVAQAARFRLLIDAAVQTDSNKLHSYADFVKNMESDVSVADGLARSTIPGIKSFSIKRSAALRTQLATYLAGVSSRQSRAPGLPALRWIPGSGQVMTIRYISRTRSAAPQFSIFNARGLLVASYTGAPDPAGTYEFSWDTRASAAGWYLVQVVDGGIVATTRVATIQ